MPPQRSPHRSHSRTLSPYSPPPNRRPPIDVIDFVELIENPEDYDRIQTALFGRHDLMIKTMMVRHIQETRERLRMEIQRQWTIAEQLFDEMVNTGLHQQLGDVGREPVVIVEQEEIHVIDNIDDPLPPYRRTPSPEVPLITRRRSTSPPPEECSLPTHEALLEEVCGQATLYEVANRGDTRQNPILVDDRDDEDENSISPTDLYCYKCNSTGHSYYDCRHYMCDNCYVHAPGHPVSDCYYR